MYFIDLKCHKVKKIMTKLVYGNIKTLYTRNKQDHHFWSEKR